jgi:hypothetical protein
MFILKKIILLVIIIMLLSVNVVETKACSGGNFRTPVIPDSSEYIFLGEVIDIVGPITYEELTHYSLSKKTLSGKLHSEKFADKLYGIRVKVIQDIQMNRVMCDTVDVYSFWTGSDCSPNPYEYDLLNSIYTPGKIVLVHAKKSKFVKSTYSKCIPKIESWFRNGGFITESLVNQRFFEDKSSRLYYIQENDIAYIQKNKFNNVDFSGNELHSYSYLLHIELRRDLQRLVQSVDKNKIEHILKRMVNYVWYTRSEYYELANKYLEDPDLITELLARKKDIDKH